jgi:hypothetical protein
MAVIPDTSCAVKCPMPSITGMYSNIGKLIIAPPIPNIPEINEPTKPMRKIVMIKLMSILPSF